MNEWSVNRVGRAGCAGVKDGNETGSRWSERSRFLGELLEKDPERELATVETSALRKSISTNQSDHVEPPSVKAYPCVGKSASGDSDFTSSRLSRLRHFCAVVMLFRYHLMRYPSLSNYQNNMHVPRSWECISTSLKLA